MADCTTSAARPSAGVNTRVFTPALALLFGALLLAACSGGTDRATDDGRADDGTDSSGTSETVRAELPEPEIFTGPLEAFYEVPDPLPEGEPGQLIRVQEVSTADGLRTVRIMYHSRDTAGNDRAVTGLVTHPLAEAPEDGWPIVATAPGTVGLASQCAPSRNDRTVATFGVDGVGVLTDYIGMGPIGQTQAYLSRHSEGNSVLDSVRAAQQLAQGSAGEQLLIFGHSQGGHGAQSAHELAPSYAPEFDVLGTVSAAPAAMFDRTYGPVDDIVARIVTTLGLYGAATDQPEIVPEDYLGPEALALTDVVQEKCIAEVISSLVPVAASPTYWAADPMTTEPAKSVLERNDVGNEARDAPMLLVSGTDDIQVAHERTMDLFERLCSNGQVTELIVLEGADHSAEVPQATPQIEAFMAARLRGDEPTDSC